MAGEPTTTVEPDYTANLAALGETFEAETPASTPNEQAPNPDPEAGAEPKTEPKQEGGEQPKPVQGDQSSGKPNSGKQQGKEKEGQNPPGPKDLTLQDGTVIKGGAERRYYEAAQIAKGRLGEATKQIQALTTEVNELRTKTATFETSMKAISSLPPEQVTAATRLYADLSRDMPGTLTKLLAEAKAMGHNIEGIGGAVDTAAIARMLEAQANNRQPENQGPQLTEAQIAQQAEQEVGEFFARYPDAVLHEDVIAKILTAHPDVPITEIYFKLREDVARKGLDWYQPLAPQVQALSLIHI